jgi:hypothetical protein
MRVLGLLGLDSVLPGLLLHYANVCLPPTLSSEMSSLHSHLFSIRFRDNLLCCFRGPQLWLSCNLFLEITCLLGDQAVTEDRNLLSAPPLCFFG